MWGFIMSVSIHLNNSWVMLLCYICHIRVHEDRINPRNIFYTMFLAVNIILIFSACYKVAMHNNSAYVFAVAIMVTSSFYGQVPKTPHTLISKTSEDKSE
jgi:hypothetical protein